MYTSYTYNMHIYYTLYIHNAGKIGKQWTLCGWECSWLLSTSKGLEAWLRIRVLA